MSVRVFTPPERPVDPEGLRPAKLFLAGTIDMGISEDWQGRLVAALKIGGFTLDICNPRRANWDTSWEQSIKNEKFREQVVWELDLLEAADIVAFHFEPDSKSPITLMELGYIAGRLNTSQHVIVSCPPGYWRRGNVEIMCDRHAFNMVNGVDELLATLLTYLGDEQ